MPTGKRPAKQAPPIPRNRPKKTTAQWDGDGPIDEDLAHKLASALLSNAKPSDEDAAAHESDSQES
tara:strand:+ start:258 stop:455 length:198 start_codon:yes stop_codon:yes gene_type:complete